MITSLWERLKIWRRLTAGPIRLVFKFERTPLITSGSRNHRVTKTREVRVAIPALDFDESGAAQSEGLAGDSTISRGTAVIVGVGPGFGYAVARRLVAEGFDLVMVSRNADRLTPLATELKTYSRRVSVHSADATDELSVDRMFHTILSSYGVPKLVIYSIQEFSPGETLDVSVPAFESAWRHNCLGAFLVSRAAGRAMKQEHSGTILLIGSTSSILAREGHLNLAIGKFGQRALAQVLARELWPAGIHVAHVLIDADISEDSSKELLSTKSSPEDIAMSILALHDQPRTAWSSEIDIRPWNEKFWEHC